MQIPRLYLGEITGVALAVLLLFGAGALAARYFPGDRRVRMVRNACIAIVVGIFAASMVYSIEVNEIPRAQVDRSGADQDQRAFEQRHK